MLKRHQACIDLSKNALVIAGREIPFLAEHEVPEASRVGGGFGEMEEALKESAESSKPPAASSTNPFRNSGSSSQATSSTTSATTSTQANRTSAPSATPTFPEEAITTLTSLGISREQAIQALEACDGNVEMAASFLFGS
ncbi:hypothetical protein BDF22DRAFT_501601 [Syncephalis plumigaleata]|nr:hypothetical protein BDF22DRAFT_501601 [Syncephalis plumigaleata]